MIVTSKRLAIHNANGVTLLPGPNVIAAAAWREARNHPMVQMDLDYGNIVEDQELEEAELLSPADEILAEDSILVNMKIPAAKAMVEETIDLALLARWKSVEKRNHVIGAINRQIELLNEPAEERDRNASRALQTGNGAIEISVRNPEDT
jgi:hypothetical protein